MEPTGRELGSQNSPFRLGNRNACFVRPKQLKLGAYGSNKPCLFSFCGVAPPKQIKFGNGHNRDPLNKFGKLLWCYWRRNERMKPRQREFPLVLSFQIPYEKQQITIEEESKQRFKNNNFQTLYLSSEAVTSPSAAGQSPCQVLSSAAAAHNAALQDGAACIPALSSVHSIGNRQRRERGYFA